MFNDLTISKIGNQLTLIGKVGNPEIEAPVSEKCEDDNIKDSHNPISFGDMNWNPGPVLNLSIVKKPNPFSIVP